MEYLVQFGAFGMFVAALLAGSVLPFSSEAVMTALQLAGVSSLDLLVWGTLGNLLGSGINYGLGRLGKIEWLERNFHLSRERLVRCERFVDKYGPPMGLLSWIPFFGEAIAVALGLMRANFPLTMLYMAIGKAARYAVLLYAVDLVR